MRSHCFHRVLVTKEMLVCVMQFLTFKINVQSPKFSARQLSNLGQIYPPSSDFMCCKRFYPQRYSRLSRNTITIINLHSLCIQTTRKFASVVFDVFVLILDTVAIPQSGLDTLQQREFGCSKPHPLVADLSVTFKQDPVDWLNHGSVGVYLTQAVLIGCSAPHVDFHVTQEVKTRLAVKIRLDSTHAN